MRPHRLEDLFNPQAVAIVGASDNTRMLALMKSLGFSIRTAPYDPTLKVVEHWL